MTAVQSSRCGQPRNCVVAKPLSATLITLVALAALGVLACGLLSHFNVTATIIPTQSPHAFLCMAVGGGLFALDLVAMMVTYCKRSQPAEIIDEKRGRTRIREEGNLSPEMDNANEVRSRSLPSRKISSKKPPRPPGETPASRFSRRYPKLSAFLGTNLEDSPDQVELLLKANFLKDEILESDSFQRRLYGDDFFLYVNKEESVEEIITENQRAPLTLKYLVRLEGWMHASKRDLGGRPNRKKGKEARSPIQSLYRPPRPTLLQYFRGLYPQLSIFFDTKLDESTSTVGVLLQRDFLRDEIQGSDQLQSELGPNEFYLYIPGLRIIGKTGEIIQRDSRMPLTLENLIKVSTGLSQKHFSQSSSRSK